MTREVKPPCAALHDSCYALCVAAAVCVGCNRETANETSRGSEVHVQTELSSDIDRVHHKVDRILASVYSQKLPDRLPPWIAFHALLMYGDSASQQFLQDREPQDNLRRIYSIILNSNTRQNGPYVIRSSLPYPRHSGPYFFQEHHPAQFLNYYSMGGGSLGAVITVDGTQYTIRDLMGRSMLEVDLSGELAYAVLSFSHYLHPHAHWKNKFGDRLSLPILVATLLRREEATCLGTHRLAALARTLSRPSLRANPEMEKLWKDVQREVRNALFDLKQNQLSNSLFRPPGPTPGSSDVSYRHIFYGGHSLEWISFLDVRYARSDWVVHAVESLVEEVEGTYLSTYRNLDIIGDDDAHFDFDGLSHAVSGLRRWSDKVQN